MADEFPLRFIGCGAPGLMALGLQQTPAVQRFVKGRTKIALVRRNPGPRTDFRLPTPRSVWREAGSLALIPAATSRNSAAPALSDFLAPDYLKP